jgi:hypothetical protein
VQPPTLRPERKAAKLSGKRLPRDRAARPVERTGIAGAAARATRVGVGGVAIERPPVVAVAPTNLAPLLLLPLRLEYRVVTSARPPVVVDFSSELETFKAIDARRANRSRRAEQAREVRRRRRCAAEAADGTLDGRRWRARTVVPLVSRLCFARKGTAPPNDAETVAINTYRTLGIPWYAPASPDALGAWQSFATAVGPYRAVHLLRSRTESVAGRYEETIGRIAMLPGKVTLFAVKGEILTPLGSGRVIPANRSGERSAVSYTPEAIQPGGWLRDFAVAESVGMGVRITNTATVDKALDADHIIAIGRFGGETRAELSNLLKDTIAAGAFSFLRQDTPTTTRPAPRPASSILTRICQAFAAATQEAGAFAGVTDTGGRSRRAGAQHRYRHRTIRD